MSSARTGADSSVPFSIEAEKAVLGAVILNAEYLTLVEGILEPGHFYFDPHKKIFSAIQELSKDGESVDILTVSEKLRSVDGEKKHLSPTYLVELTEHCPVAQNVEHYAQLVRRYFYMRRVIATCEETIRSAKAFEGNVESFVEQVEKEFLSIAGEYDRKGIVQADVVLESTIEEIQRSLEQESGVTGVTSGFAEMDQLLGGFQKSDLIILAARPGMGKTALTLNLATAAMFAQKSVAIFSLEMSKEQLMARVLSSVARVDSARLRKGDLSDEEQDRLMEGARRIFEHKKFMGIDETPGITLMELRSRCRRYHKEFGLDMVLIDYLQLMSGSGVNKNESREREISQISGGLKMLAKELAIPVIACAQLNRGPDARPDKRPKISDLRESGSMEQDADIIMFVYRDEYYNPNSELTGIAEVIVAKNRHGSQATVKLAYQPNFVSFNNLYKAKDS